MSFEIGRVLETQEPFCLKVKDVVASRTYIASETRFGKSHTARRIIEKCFGQVGIIIIDPEGEYASLREKYSFIIIGRDIPMEVETETVKTITAELMAEQILETKTSAIIDLSVSEDIEAGKDYVNTFLRKFFHLQTAARQPYLIIWEEAEDFAPESGAPGSRTCLEVAIAYARRGGKRGIGVIFVGHRPAWISKGILSQCPNKAIGRIESTDMKALEEYARIPRSIVEKLVPKSDEEGSVIYPGPTRGEFCFTGDWVEKTTFVKVGPVETTHLGSTPEIIPPSPKEITNVIENLRKMLPSIIEKIKPAIISKAELESKIKAELEGKYKNKIDAILKTADEKAERKYRVRIDELQGHLEKLSRSQALQPVAPLTNVLEHPIVKTRMLELSDKARDLLIKIENEPGLTREQLAAFLTTSTNSVANLVQRINQVFHSTAIIGDGKPIRYKSMLKRLFITDVADREIKELERLQNENKTKTERIKVLEDETRMLRSDAQQSITQRNELEKLRQDDAFLKQTNTNLVAALDTAKGDIEQLKKEAEVVQKLRELLSVGTSGMDVEKRLATFRSDLTTELQQLLDQLVQAGEKALPQIEALIDKKIKELTPTPAPANAISTSVELEHKVTHFDFQKLEEHLKADTTTLEGRIIFLITKEFFNNRHDRKEIVTELSNNGWTHGDKDVDAALLELCGKGIFYRKISTGNKFWFNLQEGAKERIHA